jgi:hypothetical protein
MMVSTVDTCVSAQKIMVQRQIVRFYTENAVVALWRVIVVVRVECRGYGVSNYWIFPPTPLL